MFRVRWVTSGFLRTWPDHLLFLTIPQGGSTNGLLLRQGFGSTRHYRFAGRAMGGVDLRLEPCSKLVSGLTIRMPSAVLFRGGGRGYGFRLHSSRKLALV